MGEKREEKTVWFGLVSRFFLHCLCLAFALGGSPVKDQQTQSLLPFSVHKSKEDHGPLMGYHEDRTVEGKTTFLDWNFAVCFRAFRGD